MSAIIPIKKGKGVVTFYVLFTDQSPLRIKCFKELTNINVFKFNEISKLIILVILKIGRDMLTNIYILAVHIQIQATN